MEQEKLIRFIAGQTNASEQKEVLGWIEQSPSNKRIFAQLKNIDVAVNVFAEERTHVTHVKKSFSIIKPILRWSIRIAAVLIIGFSLFYLGTEKEKTKWIKSSEKQFTEIKVPMGESVSVSLPDGSKVKLNSGSVLKFSKLFGQMNRELSLDGEGYFEVKKNKKKFIVITSDINVEVLGTKFNLSAYNADRVVTASLYKGKVKIVNTILKETVVLNPEDSYIFDKVSKKATMKSFNKKHGWMNNYFVANSDDIEVFVQKIERKYNVKIVVEPNLIGKCRYTGVFKGESLEEILKNMALASPIKYKIKDNNTVLIYKKKNK
ncbi:MAG: FecR family protein [Bacteroidales bacterium]